MSRSGDWIGFIPRTIPKRWHYGERGALPTFSGEKKKEKERGEKTPLKAAHANEELARWRDLEREEGQGERVCGGGGDLFNSCGFCPNSSSNCDYFFSFAFNATRLSLFTAFSVFGGFASLKVSPVKLMSLVFGSQSLLVLAL